MKLFIGSLYLSHTHHDFSLLVSMILYCLFLHNKFSIRINSLPLLLSLLKTHSPNKSIIQLWALGPCLIDGPTASNISKLMNVTNFPSSTVQEKHIVTTISKIKSQTFTISLVYLHKTLLKSFIFSSGHVESFKTYNI